MFRSGYPLMSFLACLPSFLVGILVMIPLHHFRHEFFDMIYLPPCDLHLSSLFRELPSICTAHHLQNEHVYTTTSLKNPGFMEFYRLPAISLEGRLLHIFLGCVAAGGAAAISISPLTAGRVLSMGDRLVP